MSVFLGLALLIGVLSCFFFLDRAVGVSMEPTLSHNSLCVFRRGSSPERGDIVAARLDWLTEYEIKDVVRVIGVPGDVVEIREGALYVNSEASPLFPEGGLIPGDVDYPVALGEGEYFVMGDNQGNSFDSRFRRYGLLREADIAGIYAGRIGGAA